ncbi:MAG: CHAT domain-containing protein [Pyrinomonadaceae bacterium]|nr:CHAT domain-containing protein [Pyrinomonadaceae bacterium]
MGFFNSINKGIKQIRGGLLLNKTDWLLSAGRFKEAIQVNKEALELFEEIGFKWGIGAASGNLSLSYYQISDAQEALFYAKYSLKITTEISDKKGMAYAYAYLSSAYQLRGAYEKAFSIDKKSYELAKKLNDPQAHLFALSNIGAALIFLGRYVDSIAYIDKSFDIIDKKNNKKSNRLNRINLLISKGVVYRAIGEQEYAETLFTQALEESRATFNQVREAEALAKLASISYIKGDFEKAIAESKAGLKIKREIGDLRGQAEILTYIAKCYQKIKRYAEAFEVLQESLALSKKIQFGDLTSINLSEIGLYYVNIGDLEKAQKYQEEALDTINSEMVNTDTSAIYQRLAYLAARKKDYTKAEDLIRKSCLISETIQNHLGNKDEFKVSFFENQSIDYRHLQYILVKQEKYEEALEISERAKARVLVEILASQLSSEDKARELADSPDINRIKEIARQRKITLVVYSFIPVLESNSLEKAEDFEIFIWVVLPNGKIEFRRTEALISNNLISDFNRNALTVADQNQMREAIYNPEQNYSNEEDLSSLYKLLIEPIKEFLPADENSLVTFIPDSTLFSIPFAALIDKEKEEFLIQRHTISISPSIQLLELTEKQRERVKNIGKDSVLIIGNPKMPKITFSIDSKPEQLPPLRYAEQEAIKIAKLFDTKACVGSKATKKFVLSQIAEQKIVHLATHGVFNDLNRSKTPGELALAPSESDDGLLTAEEIARLKINADLVVLSACNTAQGRFASDGIIGLFRAFILSGVPSVIVSLWSIPDAPTAELMINFYEELKISKNKAQSLRRAMLETMKTHKSPRNWAAFLLIGAPDQCL